MRSGAGVFLSRDAGRPRQPTCPAAAGTPWTPSTNPGLDERNEAHVQCSPRSLDDRVRPLLVREKVASAAAPGGGQTGPFVRVARKRAFEEALLQIENAILSGQLRSGDRLPSERELASLLGLGRPAVREALRVLDAVGLVQARRGSGGRAGSIVEAGTGALAGLLALHAATRNIPLADLVEVREALEGMGARAAARARDATELNRIVEAMDAEVDNASAIALGTSFHMALAKLSRNSVLPLLMEQLREAIARRSLDAFSRLSDPAAERRKLTLQHKEIARLIGLGEGERAARAVESHVRGFYSRFLETGDRRANLPVEEGTVEGAIPGDVLV